MGKMRRVLGSVRASQLLGFCPTTDAVLFIVKIQFPESLVVPSAASSEGIFRQPNLYPNMLDTRSAMQVM